MIEFYKTTSEGLVQLEQVQPGCWVNIISPTIEDRKWLLNEMEVAPEFVVSAMDDEERSHVDLDDDTGQALVIMDCPFVEEASQTEDLSITQYDTHPLAALFVPEKDIIITVTLRENQTITAFAQGKQRGMNTNQRSRLLLQMMMHISRGYVKYLRNIDRQFNENEKKLRKTMRNTELIKMLGFEKSLVYFSTSLKSFESTLMKISSGRVIKLYEDDRELLDDVFIEIRQAMEMCTIYTSILNGTMDTFSSVISNNMNATIRTLTIVTLVFAIPTIIFSFYGMNTAVLPADSHWAYPLVLSLVACVICAIILARSKLLK
ncbi:MAG: magnesium transporter CorA family protein [Coriobacteriia bacterium]|nr:magnesium transporter CorA family protein [Coriobacteriia bacterium]